jgi:subtilisin family serine protease
VALASPAGAGGAPVLPPHGEKPVVDAVTRKLDRRLRDAAGAAARVLRDGAPADPARTHVYVRVVAVDAETLAALAARGLEIVTSSAEFGLVDGWIAPDDARALAALPGVVSVRPVGARRRRVGTVTTEGDAALGAASVRAAGYEGAGVVVGVVSDGIDSAGLAISRGDLSGVAVPPDPRCRAGSGDEGTAMLEIVHDLAPAATLLFSSAGESGLQMADAVRCLAAAGARVIVDDVGFSDDPYFQDGALATAVRDVAAAGVSYHSAAGNDAEAHYEAPYAAIPAGDLHDFGGGDATNDVVVAQGRVLFCALQWSEPFGAASSDYDLFLYKLFDDGSAITLDAGTNVQSGTQDPYEEIAWQNTTGSDQVVSLAVRRPTGVSRTIETFCFGLDAMEHPVAAGSIYGHPGVPEAIAVGAIDVLDAGLDDLEPFSSHGPAAIEFPAPESRAKPDLVAVDGTATAVTGFTTFFGTSAAAPHSAAVAALLLSKNPALGPADVQRFLRDTAADLGAPGFDAAFGAGRLRADVAAAALPCSGDAQCGDGNACTSDICGGTTCAHDSVDFADTMAALRSDLGCPDDRVPRFVVQRFHRAERLVERAATAGARRRTKLLKRARRALDRAVKRVDRARRNGKLRETCATSVTNELRATDAWVACLR